jgi:hypothetical protein
VRQQADKCVPCEYLRPRSTVCRRQNLLSRQLEPARGCQLKTPTSVLDMREMVSLESCIVDEPGLAVHENCSVAGRMRKLTPAFRFFLQRPPCAVACIFVLSLLFTLKSASLRAI